MDTRIPVNQYNWLILVRFLNYNPNLKTRIENDEIIPPPPVQPVKMTSTASSVTPPPDSPLNHSGVGCVPLTPPPLPRELVGCSFYLILLLTLKYNSVLINNLYEYNCTKFDLNTRYYQIIIALT